MGRHAYLIMVHNNFDVLNKIIELLDDARNDIYLHIDFKAGFIDEENIIKQAKESKINFIHRKNIRWAGYSGIDCEIRLLKTALENGPYDYYHLISGADLPIKSQNEIHEFFEKNAGSEFVEYDNEIMDDEYLDRVKYFYLFQDVYGRNRKNPFLLGLFAFDKVSLKIQKLIKTNRIKKCNNVWQKGPNWFSITDAFARYVVEKEDWIYSTFKYSISGDEMFLQTILADGEFSGKIYKDGCVRLIDWERGKPYTYTADDYQELMSAKDFMFARKFSPDKDNEIINMIYKKFKK